MNGVEPPEGRTSPSAGACMYRTTPSTVCLLCCASSVFECGATAVAVALTFTCLAATETLAEELNVRVLANSMPGTYA